MTEACSLSLSHMFAKFRAGDSLLSHVTALNELFKVPSRALGTDELYQIRLAPSMDGDLQLGIMILQMMPDSKLQGSYETALARNEN